MSISSQFSICIPLENVTKPLEVYKENIGLRWVEHCRIFHRVQRLAYKFNYNIFRLYSLITRNVKLKHMGRVIQVWKYGSSKICGRQSLKNFTWFILEHLETYVNLINLISKDNKHIF